MFTNSLVKWNNITNYLPTSSASTVKPSTSASASGPPAATLAQVIPAPCEPLMPIPERYADDLGSCGHFLLQCSLIFSHQPSTYATDKSYVSFVMNLFIGKTAQWLPALWESASPICISFPLFMSEMKVFDHPVQGKEAAIPLLTLCQGTQLVAIVMQ